MHPSHTDWFNTTLEKVIPVDSGTVGAIALARQIDEEHAAFWRPFMLLLTKQGKAIAGSDWLPIAMRGNGGNLVVTGDREALVVVTQRDNDHPQSIVDVPHWFSVTWRESKVNVVELGRWDGINLGLFIHGAAGPGGSVWAGSYCPPPLTQLSGHKDTLLILGHSRDGQLPRPQLTEIECVDVSNPVFVGDEIYVLVSARFERIELWCVDPKLNLQKVVDVASIKKKGKETLGPPRLARCGDTLLMFWGHYTDKVGDKRPRTWQGLLHAASYEPASETFSRVINATTDTRLVAATLDVHPLGDSVVVTWESRPKRGGGGMRTLRCASIADLPRDPVTLPVKYSPLFIPRAPGPILQAGRVPEDSSWAIPAEIPPL